MNQIIRFLKMTKEGIFIGVLVGILLTIYIYSSGGDLSFANVGRSGLIESAWGTSMSLKQLAITKVGSTLILICATIGMIIDYLMGKKR